MLYKSTRGKVNGITFKEAVMMGLAEDGGLLIPQEVETISKSELIRLSSLSYFELAYEIISKFATDIKGDILKSIVEKSYKNFETDEIVPILKKGDLYIAELFHGPTYAFKDIALQFLGNIFEYILQERSSSLNILGATSGDTGSAAIYGVKGKKNINIFILHPKGKVSPIQELQMTTVTDKNVYNLAIDGNFDDCQYIVKEIFSDIQFKKTYNLGAINSINWARIVAQIVYYFYSYFKVAKGDKKVNIVVPTGNFGNIFAGYFAKMMGLPIDKLVIASNENNILTRFVNNGDYSIKNVVETYSPSMDIQIASNFERYLYYFYNDPEIVVEKMRQLSLQKKIIFTDEELKRVRKDFAAHYTSNEETLETIKEFYERYNYILDPHTACGVNAALKLNLEGVSVCLATAHPAKFFDPIQKAIGVTPKEPEGIKRLKGLPKKVYEVENRVEAVKTFIQEKLK
jgi:threonine synthase